MTKRRRTPLQRRAAFRLAAMARGMFPPKDPAQPTATTEIAGPAALILAVETGQRGTGRRRALQDLTPPAALAIADPLPLAPILPLGKKLALAIKRLDMLKTPLDLLEPGQ